MKLDLMILNNENFKDVRVKICGHLSLIISVPSSTSLAGL